MCPTNLVFIHFIPLQSRSRHHGAASPSHVLWRPRIAATPHRRVSMTSSVLDRSKSFHNSKPNVVDMIIEDESHQNILHPNSAPVGKPILVFMPGLDAQPLPKCQIEPLKDKYIIVSIRHNPNDRSDWERLVQASLPMLTSLREKSSTGLTVVGESFGAAFALRMVATCSPGVVERLLLINSGTAIMKDDLLNTVTSLLPILRVDRSERLYKAAAVFLFKVLLAKENRLATDSFPEEDFPILRSFDTRAAPLDAMLHRVSLLRSFSSSFPDSCIRDLVQVPTILVASGRDRLLRSREEMERLAGLLKNVKRKIVLNNSAHAALLEKEVSLASILEGGGTEGATYRGVERKSLDDDAYRAAVKLGRQIFGPWLEVTSPMVLGKENVGDALQKASKGAIGRPILFVGNHSVFGLLDLPILFAELTEMLGDKKLRSLAASIHFRQYADVTRGRWGQFVSDLGAVQANARNFYRLLSNGENILLFPGGAREVCRRRNERYKLFWKRDIDFVRPAVRFNALIVPFSAVGADDAVDIFIDGQELQRLPYIGSMLRSFLDKSQLSKDNLMPIGSFPPRTDRLYFKFHDPIDTSGGDCSDLLFCKSVYKQCRHAVEEGIEDLIKVRAYDPGRKLSARIREDVRSGVPGPRVVLNSMMGILGSIFPTFEA